MKRMLLATTAAVACLMLTPSADARSASRPEQAVAVSVEAGEGAGDGFLSVAQAAPTESDEEDDEDVADADRLCTPLFILAPAAVFAIRVAESGGRTATEGRVDTRRIRWEETIRE